MEKLVASQIKVYICIYFSREDPRVKYPVELKDDIKFHMLG